MQEHVQTEIGNRTRSCSATLRRATPRHARPRRDVPGALPPDRIAARFRTVGFRDRTPGVGKRRVRASQVVARCLLQVPGEDPDVTLVRYARDAARTFNHKPCSTEVAVGVPAIWPTAQRAKHVEPMTVPRNE